MNTIVLLIMLFGTTGEPAMTTIDFSSMSGCELTAREIKLSLKNNNSSKGIVTFCLMR